MKDIKTITKVFLATFMLVLGLGVLSAVTPQRVLAAGCTTGGSKPDQIAEQEACIKRYKQVCKKDYKNAFCESLTVNQINKCATGSGTKFKDDCMKDLEKKFKPDAADSDEDSGGSTLPDPTKSNDCKASSFSQLNSNNCGIIKMVIVITNAMSALVGVVIVAMLVWGGIQYSSAGADPSKVQAAKQKIINAIIALVLFIFGYALLQWLVPGGIF